MADEKAPSYEQAREELTEVVRRLETGGLTLEQSIELWERGEKLAAICEEWLRAPGSSWPPPWPAAPTRPPPAPDDAPF